MVDTTPTRVGRTIGLSGSRLAKAIFEAESPEQFIRTVPAQSLFVAIREQGLGSSADLIEIATTEQMRLLLDFDFWYGDSLAEDRIWEWLAVTDATDSLSILQRVFKGIDLKIVGVLIARYVQVQTMDEPSEQPHAPGFYTPDKGYTWLLIDIENQDHQFLLARFLALIFETNADLFYQLLSIPGVSTESSLQEEAFQDRNKRLASEGIPEPEIADEITLPLSDSELIQLLSAKNPVQSIIDIQPVAPLVYGHFALEPLGGLLAQLTALEDFESELSYVINAAIVRWKVDFPEIEQLRFFAGQVRGALNIGLARALEKSSLSALAIYQQIGVRGLFRSGLAPLISLRNRAQKISSGALENVATDQALGAIVSQLRQPFPSLPNFLSENGTPVNTAEQLDTLAKPIETMAALRSARTLIEQHFPQAAQLGAPTVKSKHEG